MGLSLLSFISLAISENFFNLAEELIRAENF
jgi:hypothetical protein